jgi:serine/threonine protein kinase/Tol biopolymer transport system component
MPELDSLIGQQIDQYKVLRLIGQGGMAAVYLAHDLTLDREVVLKTMLPALAQNEELMRRFEREAKATARLEHSNIVPIYVTGMTAAGQPYIAMQYINGGSLSDYLRQLTEQKQWLSTIYALSIVRQIADALRVAHQAEIIHRDLKPSNILLRRDGTPVLSDLGIAAIQQATTRLTQTGNLLGTPTYMSPEQGAGKNVDGRSDIYSLGIILYELLSGQLPFEADSPWAMIHQHIYEPPHPLEQFRPDLTPQTLQIVVTCLQKEPANRFQSAAELVAALDRAMAAEDTNQKVSVGSWQPAAPRIIDGPPTTRRRLQQPAVDTPQSAAPTVAKGKRPYWQYILPAGLLVLIIGSILVFREGFTFSSPSATPAREASELATLEPSGISVSFEGTALPTSTVQLVAAGTDGTIVALNDSADPTATPTLEPITPTAMAFVTNPFPDGLIAYSCAIGNGENRIFLSSPDGNAQFQLPNQPGNSIVPAFSRDGRQLAYRSDVGGSWQIYVSNADGNNLRQITSGNSSSANFEAAWSPDGSRFVFASERDGTRQIYVMNSDGTNQQRLTFNDAYNDDPSWSANGQIIYESNENGRYSIFQILPDGGVPIELITLGESSSTPAWSYDGQWLAFESRIEGDRDIWIARADDSDLQPVVALGSSDERPAWSPDGTQIAFHSNYLQADEDDVDIWVMNLDTQTPVRLTENGHCYDPSWAVVPLEMLVNLALAGEVTMPVSNNSSDWPVSETGVEACHLLVGTAVTTGANARFWSQPDVLTGSVGQSLASGASLRVVDGPTWGPIRLDTSDHGWWWQLTTEDGSATGWLWQGRLNECS